MVQEAVGVIRNIDRSRMANMWQSPLRATFTPLGSRGRMLATTCHVTPSASKIWGLVKMGGCGWWHGRSGSVQQP